MSANARVVDQVVTNAEAAEIIGISVRRLRQYLDAGRITGRQVNERMWLIARADAEAFERAPPGRPPAKK